jgi:hypothetical protein
MSKLLLFILFPLLLFGCAKPQTSDLTSQEKEMYQPVVASTPEAVVTSFLNATLGTLPEAEVDYDKAKELMSAEYVKQFTTPMFIPQAYGMQDGPSSVEITDQEILTDTAVVTALGRWGTENQMYWQFNLVKQAGQWKLDFINPGQ